MELCLLEKIDWSKFWNVFIASMQLNLNWNHCSMGKKCVDCVACFVFIVMLYTPQPLYNTIVGILNKDCVSKTAVLYPNQNCIDYIEKSDGLLL